MGHGGRPIRVLGVEVALVAGGVFYLSQVAALAAALVLNTLLAFKDRAALTRAGLTEWNPFIVALVVPIYLIWRAVKVRGTALIPVLWTVTTIMYAGGSYYAQTNAPIPIDTSTAEDEIEAWFAEDDIVGTADCPTEAAEQVGDSFACTLTSSDEYIYRIDVTVDDRDGTVFYQVVD